MLQQSESVQKHIVNNSLPDVSGTLWKQLQAFWQSEYSVSDSGSTSTQIVHHFFCKSDCAVAWCYHCWRRSRKLILERAGHTWFFLGLHPPKEIRMTHRDHRNLFAFDVQSDAWQPRGVQEVLELLVEHDSDGLAQAMQILIDEAMKLERSQVLARQPNERTADAPANRYGWQELFGKLISTESICRRPPVTSAGFAGLRTSRSA